MRYIIILILGITLTFSCKKKSVDETPSPAPETESLALLEKEVLNTYLNIGDAVYEDAYSTVDSLSIHIEAFCHSPTAEKFEACKYAWKRARIMYGQTEAYRGVEGPIDNYESYINGWPLDEAYIDYVYDSSKATNVYKGIINDTLNYKEINYNTLREANEKLGDASVTTGYHAIEFLLWGQDFYTDSPGKRSFTDYTIAPNAERRRQYLLTVVFMLKQDIANVRLEFKGNYRADLLVNVSLNYNCFLLLDGISKMSKGEFGGERIIPALETKNQEDEHSCFSDNTHVDLVTNALGMQNIYLGVYKRKNGLFIKGRSLSTLIDRLNPGYNANATQYISNAVTESLQIGIPFDRAILSDLGGHIKNTAQAWVGFSDELKKAALAIQSAK